MKKLIFTMLIFSISTSYAQNWTALTDYPCTSGGDGVVTFTIGDKIYTGGGFISNCFYEYNTSTDRWTQKTDLPVTRCKAFGIAFANNGKGYVGLGFDMNGSVVNCKNDLWEYDPTTDKWTQKANYPGGGCDAHFSFVIGNKAYVGGGEKPLVGIPFRDAYEYDPVNDKWTAIASYPDSPGVISPFSFSIGNKGYVSCGTQGSGEVVTTYEYDPVLDKWTPRADFGGSPRQGGVSFIMNGKAYCGWGDDYITHKKDFYHYDAVSDKWEYAFDGPGDARTFAGAAAVNNIAYAGLGWSQQVDNYFDWYKLTTTSSVREVKQGNSITAFPNPTNGILNLTNAGNAEFTITDMSGRVLMSGIVKDENIDISSLPASVYQLVLETNGTRQSLLITRQ